MPVWDTAKGDIPWNDLPKETGFSLGGSSVNMRNIGTISLSVSSAGIQPGATAADKIAAIVSIPASVFDQAGRGIEILAYGVNATTNGKTAKLIVGGTGNVGDTISGGTAIANSGSITAATAPGGWVLGASIFKYGAGGSNTQFAVPTICQFNAVSGGMAAPQALTLTENAAFTVAATVNAATATTDITFYALVIRGLN